MIPQRRMSKNNEKVMRFIEDYRLKGEGLGYIDIHLLVSALLSEIPIWTLDKRLNKVSKEVRIAFKG